MADNNVIVKTLRDNTGLVSHAELKRILSYDPDAGIFTWLVNRGGKASSGAEAGHTSKYTGYHNVKINGRNYPANRLAWFYMTGEWPINDIDHKDLNKTNNRWDNLRPATISQNKGNISKHSNNTSGYKGVTWHKHRKMWAAKIGVNNKRISLGYYHTPEEASEAYKKASQEYFGEFARFE